MMTQQIIALILLLLQGFLFFYTSQKLAIPVTATIIAVAGMITGRSICITRDRKIIYTLLLVLAFTLKWRFAPYDLPTAAGFFMYPVTYSLSSCFLILQAIQFHLDRKEGMSPMYPFLGATVLACTGNLYMKVHEERLYLILSIAFSLLTAAYLASGKRVLRRAQPGALIAKGVLATVLGVAVVSLSVTTSMLMVRHEKDMTLIGEQLSRLFLNIPSSQGGFSRTARLGSLARMKLADNMQAVALRVYADSNPGYMRGGAYATYASAEWEAPATARRLKPAETDLGLPSPVTARGKFFEISDHRKKNLAVIDVWPAQAITEGMFAPLGVVSLRAPITDLDVDTNEIMASDDLASGVNYVEYVDKMREAGNPPAAEEAELYTSVPAELHPDIRGLADRIMQNSRTPQEKIRAVVGYLQDNHKYRLGVKVPQGEEPLTWFLMNREAAHCEYFASAAAILLRLGGVPTRYINGFVVTDRNSVGGYWIAKKETAHAWVEAYVPGSGWMLVEATPPAGIPASPGLRNKASSYMDWLKFQLLQFQVAFYTEGVAGVMRWALVQAQPMIAWFVSDAAGATIVKVILVLVLSRKLYRRMRIFLRQRPTDKTLFLLHHLLAKADRLARRSGMRREAAETVGQFASRLEKAADRRSTNRSLVGWYERYVDVRYSARRTYKEALALGHELRRVMGAD